MNLSYTNVCIRCIRISLLGKDTSASGANNLALQITLACFVLISVVLAILSVYLYIQLKYR